MPYGSVMRAIGTAAELERRRHLAVARLRDGHSADEGLGRFRRLARDYERLAETLAGWHWVAAVVLLLRRLAESVTESP